MIEHITGSFDPEPVFEFKRPEWQAQAACHPDVIPPIWMKWGARPVDMFFPEQFVSEEQQQDIKSICSACPVQSDCETWGMLHEKIGFWGGLSRTRRQMLRSGSGIEVDTPEIDETKQVMGTYFPPSHGTYQRYRKHIKDGEPPCPRCVEGYNLAVAPLRSEQWKRRKQTESKIERRARLNLRAQTRKPRHR